MRFLAVFFPGFPLQVAVRAEPALVLRREAGQTVPPFAVAAAVSANSDVLAASAAARRAGVRPGMTVTQARVVAPGILLRARDAAAHEAARIAVAEILGGAGPRVEVVEDASGSGAVGFADVSGETRAREAFLAKETIARLEAAGFAARGAVASERFSARVVAEHGTRGIARRTPVIITPGASGDALENLPAAALGPVLGRGVQASLEAFSRLGVTTLGQVGRLPADALARRFGAHAASLSTLARGEDTTPLVPFRIPDTLFEKLEMPSPTETVEPLLFALKMLADRVGARLGGRGKAASKLLLHLVLENAPAVSLEIRLPRPTIVTRTIVEVARERLYAMVLPRAAIEMALEVTDSISTRRTQLPLFLDDGTPVDPKRAPPSPEKIAATLGRLATALGESCVFAARLSDAHRPERAWAPSVLEAGPPTDPSALEGRRPSRVLARPEAITVHPPSHGRDAEADIRGLRHRVAAMTGPERLCGDWWDEVPFDRDYFHLTTDDGARFWIFRDRSRGGFFLHGLFD